MSEMTVKEWTAEYQLINKAEREDLKRRLPLEPIEESICSYFALCKLAITPSGTADEPQELWESRLRGYQATLDKWTRLAQRLQHAH